LHSEEGIIFYVIAMDPPYPKTISLAINVPKKFGKISLIPLFQREEIEPPMCLGRADTVPSYR
jgi:hypothetical protein